MKNVAVRIPFLLFLFLFIVDNSANAQTAPLDCGRVDNIIWEGANDLLGALPGLGDTSKFLIALSKIGNNVSCNGEGLTENRVEQIAYDVAHEVLEDSKREIVKSLTSDLSDFESRGVMPTAEKFANFYETARNVEAEVHGLDFFSLDFSVALASMKLGLVNGEIAQRLESDSDYASVLIETRKSQSQISLDYLGEKEFQLNQYLSRAVVGVEVFPEPFCSDSPCYEEYRGYVEYPYYDRSRNEYVINGRGKRVYTQWRLCEGAAWQSWCKEKENAKKDAESRLTSNNNSIRQRILNNAYHSIKLEMQKYAYGRTMLEVSLSGQQAWDILDLPDIGPMYTADFNGDGLNDVFSAASGSWFIAYGGGSTWQKVNNSGIGVKDLGFGDFNGDGAMDVLANWGDGKWHVSWSALSGWQELNVSNIRPKDLGFGDFNGDGSTDILAAWGDGKWHVRWSGSGNWQVLNASNIRVNDLGFGDFNGDGRTDVMAAWGDGKWHVRWAGQGDWRDLNGSGVRVRDLAFHDFNGDGKTDAFVTLGSNGWNVSWSGHGWHKLNNDRTLLNELAFGDFNGDGITDVLRDTPVVIPPPVTCPPVTKRTESSHTWVEFRLPSSSPGTSIQFQGGQYPRYVFPACHRVWWDNMRFTCEANGSWREVGSRGSDGWCHGGYSSQPYLHTGNK